MSDELEFARPEYTIVGRADATPDSTSEAVERIKLAVEPQLEHNPASQALLQSI